jgi:hypothetical protein
MQAIITPDTFGPTRQRWRELLDCERNGASAKAGSLLSINIVFKCGDRVRVRVMPMPMDERTRAKLFVVYIGREDGVYDQRLKYLHQLKPMSVRHEQQLRPRTPVRVAEHASTYTIQPAVVTLTTASNYVEMSSIITKTPLANWDPVEIGRRLPVDSTRLVFYPLSHCFERSQTAGRELIMPKQRENQVLVFACNNHHSLYSRTKSDVNGALSSDM